MTEYSARDLYLFCSSTYEIEQMRDYAQRHFDKDKSDYNMQGFFMALSADCLRYREILDRLGVSTQLIKIEGEDIILDLQNTIQSQKEEIVRQSNVIEYLKVDRNTYMKGMIENRKVVVKQEKQIESLQKENEQLRHRDRVVSLTNETLGRYVREGKEEIERLKRENAALARNGNQAYASRIREDS